MPTARPSGHTLRRINYAWIILATGFTVLFFSSGSRFAFGLLLKPMSEDLDLSRSALSLAATCFMIVSAVFMPVAGWLVDKFSVRAVVSVAAVVASAGIGLIGLAQAQWQVVLLYGIVFAIGNGGTSVGPIGVMISRWFERGRGTATSAAMSGNALGQLVIITALATTLTVVGWRYAYMSLGIVNLLIVVPLVIAFIRPTPRTSSPLMGQDRDEDESSIRGEPAEPPVPTPETTALSVKTIFSSRQLWLLLVVYAVCGFQDFFVATHVVAFAQDKGLTAAFSGTLYAFMGLLGMFGVMSAGLLADRFGSTLPTALCFLARIVCFGLIIVSQSTAAIVVFALLYGFTFLITAPLTVTFAGSMFGAPRLGLMSGIINMTHHIAGGLGALLGGIVFDARGSYDLAFILMLVLSVVAAALTFTIRERLIAYKISSLLMRHC